MIAALPMYARPETRAAQDALWTLIAASLRIRGVPAPDRLAHGASSWSGWLDPGLVLGEVCNLPLRTVLKGRLRIVGACDYDLAGVRRGHYDSLFVVRAGSGLTPRDLACDAPSGRFAYNEATSHSGWGAPQRWARNRGLPPFRADLATGSHLLSALAVEEGIADMACIDRISWGQLKRWEPSLTEVLEVVGRTESSPGQTLVTAAANPAPHREAVTEALSVLPVHHAAVLGLRGIVQLPASDYDELPLPEHRAFSAA